jgi:hypothetical protein
MNHSTDHNQQEPEGGATPGDLAPVAAMLDRMGDRERRSAPAGFEDRMASTTQFALLAASSSKGRGTHSVGGSMGMWSGWTRVAAALMLAAAGVLVWSFLPQAATTSPRNGTNQAVLPTQQTLAAASQGDDSEVFSLVALALDGGTGSEIDSLLGDTSELDGKIRETTGLSGTSDESLDGSTM